MPLTANEHLISSTLMVVPGVSVDLPDHKGIWVGGAGTLIVTLMNNTSVTISGIAAGTLLPCRVKQITGGTATLLLLWS